MRDMIRAYEVLLDAKMRKVRRNARQKREEKISAIYKRAGEIEEEDFILNY